MNKLTKRADLINDPNHPAIKRILTLQNSHERKDTGLFYAEGVRSLHEAIKYHASIETLIVGPTQFPHPGIRNMVNRLRGMGVPVLQASPRVMDRIAQIEDPQGVGIVARQKWHSLEQVKLEGKLCWIAIEEVQSPGNLGSMIRTATAVGAAGFLFLDANVDPFNPATVRASMGSIFAQRFVRTTPQGLAQWKEPRRWRLIGTAPGGTLDYRQADYTSDPIVLLMGSEKKGLSSELLAMCDQVVAIPMSGKTDSLNIAVATGIVLYEILYLRKLRAGR